MADDDADDAPMEEEDDAFVFALYPAQAFPGPLNLAKGPQRKVFEGGSAALSTELFHCEPDGLFGFLKNLEDRAIEYGWSEDVLGILSIPQDVGNPDTEYTNLLTHYGEIPLERIAQHDATYIGGNNRPSQDSVMLYKCLMSSISAQGKTKINIWSSQYRVNGHLSGNCLLKVIIRESYLDTNASSTFIREKLASCPTIMQTCGSDITKFNQHVVLLLESLTARGETTHDLLMNLFKGYAAASDKEFVQYMARKRERNDEGEIIPWQSLMKLADEKYKQLKQDGRWCAPTAEEEKLLALEAQIKTLKQRAAKIVHKKNSKGESGAKHKRDHKKKELKRAPLPEWMMKKPSPLLFTTPVPYKGKNWWWCGPETGGKCTGQYRCHKPSECKGQAFTQNKGKKSDTNTDEYEKRREKNRKLKLSKAMAAVALSDDDDSE